MLAQATPMRLLQLDDVLQVAVKVWVPSSGIGSTHNTEIWEVVDFVTVQSSTYILDPALSLSKSFILISSISKLQGYARASRVLICP